MAVGTEVGALDRVVTLREAGRLEQRQHRMGRRRSGEPRADRSVPSARPTDNRVERWVVSMSLPLGPGDAAVYGRSDSRVYRASLAEVS